MDAMSTLQELLEQPVRAALPQIRAHLEEQIQQGADLTEDLATIAAKEPIALGELVVGPKALPGPAMVLAALSQVETLEASIAPKALFTRLLSLSPESGLEVLQLAVTRHGDASWLVPLSVEVEGAEAGLRQLKAAQEGPGFIGLCEVYAEAGHTGGLLRVACASGCLEPLMALARYADEDTIARAAAGVLCRDPEQAVLAWIVAIRGPMLEPIVMKMIPHMTAASGLRSLREQLCSCPRARLRLDIICASLRD